MIGDPTDDRCPKGCQADDLGLQDDLPGCDGVTPDCDVRVQVDPVLDRLGPRDLLEVQRGIRTPEVANRGTVVPL